MPMYVDATSDRSGFGQPIMSRSSSPLSDLQTTIRLRHGDDRLVVVETEDEDRFLLTVQAVVRACKAHDQIALVGSQLRKLLKRLGEWVETNHEDIQEAYLTTRDSDLLFLIVRKSKPFNAPLEEVLTDLDLEVANDKDFDRLRLSVLALPATSEDSVKSFLCPQAPEVGDAQ